MPKIPGLQRRGNGFYIRVRVPKVLKSAYQPTSEIVRTLGTSDYSVAAKRIHLERTKIQSEFDQKLYEITLGLKNPDMLSKYTDHELQGISFRWLADVEKQIKTASTKNTQPLHPDEKYEVLKELQYGTWLSHQESIGVMTDEFHHGRQNAARFLKSMGITFDTKSEAFAKLANLFSKAAYELNQRRLSYWEGKPFQPTDPIFAGMAENGPSGSFGQNGKKKITWRELLKEYMNDPSASRTSSTRKNYTILDRVLEELLGADVLVGNISREHIKQVRDTLLQLPSNPTKKAPGKTLQEAIKLAVENGWPRMSSATVNMYLDKLKAVFNFAEEEDYIHKSPARGISVSDEVKKKDKRKPFDLEQLQKIFSALPLLSSAADATKYWIPLLGLYTGMRLNEICQLDLTDIAQRCDVDVILVREEGDKQLKTEASVRCVPIHPDLMKFGFMSFVEKMKTAGQSRLFPDLKKDAQGYYSGNFSKWFNRFLTEAGAKKSKTSFHSFRHNFRDALRIAEIPRAASMQLGGWTGDSVDEDYGDGLPADELLKSMEKIRYKGLDLSHLYRSTEQGSKITSDQIIELISGL